MSMRHWAFCGHEILFNGLCPVLRLAKRRENGWWRLWLELLRVEGALGLVLGVGRVLGIRPGPIRLMALTI